MATFTTTPAGVRGGLQAGGSGRKLNQQIRGAWVVEAAKAYGIPWEILWGVLGLETSYGTNVSTSSAGAKGAFQFIAPTAKAYHYPYTNAQDEATFAAQAQAAAHYLADLHKQHGGNWDGALRAYSGGAYGLAQVKSSASHPSGSGIGRIKEGAESTIHEAEGAAGGWVNELLGGLGGVVLNGILILAGAVLVVYGIMVAVRPRESAFSIPTGR